MNWDTLSSQKEKASSKVAKKVDKTSVHSDDDVDAKKSDKSKSVNLDPRSDLSDEDEMIDVLGPIL